MSRLQRLLGPAGEDVEGPGRRGGSLANCKACAPLDQQSPRGARPEYFEGEFFEIVVPFCGFPKGFSERLLSQLYRR